MKTFSTTRMVDHLTEKFGLPLTVTPIGFKYICERMLTRDVLIGGEESGGIAIKGTRRSATAFSIHSCWRKSWRKRRRPWASWWMI